MCDRHKFQMIGNEIEMLKKLEGMRMSNHNKIRPVDKNNLNGKYKILFSTPQTKNSNIPMEFRGLQSIIINL